MLSTADAADLLGLQPCTLSAWREDGSQPGLAFFKLGKAVRYRYGDLLAFLETRRASSTLVAMRTRGKSTVQAATAPVASVADECCRIRLRRAKVNVALVDETMPASAPVSG